MHAQTIWRLHFPRKSFSCTARNNLYHSVLPRALATTPPLKVMCICIGMLELLEPYCCCRQQSFEIFSPNIHEPAGRTPAQEPSHSDLTDSNVSFGLSMLSEQSSYAGRLDQVIEHHASELATGKLSFQAASSWLKEGHRSCFGVPGSV